MKMRIVAAACFAAIAIACGASTPAQLAPAEPRPSGQSSLAGETYAGKNACNPKEHDRPFIIEWDATDASSFQARASTDVVFVRYEGCSLQIIDTCTNDSVRGAFGSYQPAEWTSGALEKIDIASENELYAKLPLGVASLGSRVRAGEKFHMEYFVSGTRRATRPFVYHGEIDRVPGCRGVTHFVYGFNLGAFALGSTSQRRSEDQASVLGAGGGGTSSKSTVAEKHGGDLASCRAETAKDTASCQVPVRLTLREIQPGDNPDAVAAAAPETPDAANLAGKIQATTDRERAAVEHANAAYAKVNAGDGNGCLRELDDHDRLDPRPTTLSTSPKSFMSRQRALCLMAAGRCDPGKALLRKGIDAQSPAGTAPETIDAQVDAMVGLYCGGTDAQPRDQLLHAMFVLGSSQQKPDVKTCRGAVNVIERLAPSMSSNDPNAQIKAVWRRLYDDASYCLARAGDCAAAWSVQKETGALLADHDTYKPNDENLRANFVSRTREACLGKPQGSLTAREELLRVAEELDFARRTTVDAATCRTGYERVKGTAMATPSDRASPSERSAERKLRDGALACFTRAGDCAAAWRAFVELDAWEHPQTTGRRAREEFSGTFEVHDCRWKPQGALAPRERLFFLDARLARDDQADRAGCLSAFREAKQLVQQLPTGAKDDDVDRVRDDLGEHAATCLARVRACDDARQIFFAEESARTARRSSKPPDAASIDRTFDGRWRACAP
jgi:hypothetical protein